MVTISPRKARRKDSAAVVDFRCLPQGLRADAPGVALCGIWPDLPSDPHGERALRLRRANRSRSQTRAYRPAESRRSVPMAQKLFGGGLPFSTSTERLRELFAHVEGVESAPVITDQFSGQSRGFGFVEMATGEAAAEAIRKMNGQELDGRRLTVELAEPPGSGGGRSSSGYGGYHRGGRGRW